jgi:hypothetical protein
VNGGRVNDRTEVADGAEVRSGAESMRLRWALAAGSTDSLHLV